jgi:hypothetical protein
MERLLSGLVLMGGLVSVIRRLNELGRGSKRIARELGISRNTVKDYIAAGGWTRQPQRKKALDASRRLELAGLAMLPVALPAAATAEPGPAIDAHRRACAAMQAVFAEHRRAHDFGRCHGRFLPD